MTSFFRWQQHLLILILFETVAAFWESFNGSNYL